jgi:hypothetical protein
MTRQLVNLTVEIADLSLDGFARVQQRPDRSHQLGTILDQLLSAHGEDIKLGATDDETKVLEEAASTSTTRPVQHNIPLPLSIVERPHEAGLIRSWRADSLCLCLARSRNYPMLKKSFCTGAQKVQGLLARLSYKYVRHLIAER